MRLDEHGTALGIESGRQPVEQHFQGIFLHERCVGVVGRQGVPVRHKKEAFILVLHAHPVIQCADKVAQVQLASGAHAAEHAFAMVGT